MLSEGKTPDGGLQGSEGSLQVKDSLKKTLCPLTSLTLHGVLSYLVTRRKAGGCSVVATLFLTARLEDSPSDRSSSASVC